MPESPHPAPEDRRRLAELAAVFLKLGATAFGGPAAHIAMMKDEFVQRRRWLDSQSFLDLLGATNLIPGPNSTEMAIHIGYLRAGWRGLAVAGACFILPAMLLVWALAIAYVRYQTVPEVGWLLYGVKPVITAIVAQALWGLGRSAVKGVPTAAAAGGVIILSALGVNQILLLLLAALGVLLAAGRPRPGPGSRAVPSFLVYPGLLTLGAVPASEVTPTLGRVFWFFLKIGSVLYGSGYVLLAFLQRELVERWHWLTPQQLLDAVAIGQFTPGPVFTTATFAGYLAAGHGGAVLATAGIFVPSFILVAAVNPWIHRLRRSARAGAFLDGVNAASLGLMAVVTWELGRTALADWLAVALALAALTLLLRFRVNSAWLVAGGAFIGYLAHLFP